MSPTENAAQGKNRSQNRKNTKKASSAQPKIQAQSSSGPQYRGLSPLDVSELDWTTDAVTGMLSYGIDKSHDAFTNFNNAHPPSTNPSTRHNSKVSASADSPVSKVPSKPAIKAEGGKSTKGGFQPINAGSGAPSRKRKSSTMEPEDEDHGEVGEDEKRARFLERNRVAASKCRKKKKLMNQRLEEKSRLLVQQNRYLQATLTKLKGDVLRLKQLVLLHHDCKHPPIERHLHQEAGKYLNEDNKFFAKPKDVENSKSETFDATKSRNESVKQSDSAAWLNEFHSFQEVESEALKRAGRDAEIEFDDADFQRLLLGESLDLMDGEECSLDNVA